MYQLLAKINQCFNNESIGILSNTFDDNKNLVGLMHHNPSLVEQMHWSLPPLAQNAER
jgi:hypothetical protein